MLRVHPNGEGSGLQPQAKAITILLSPDSRGDTTREIVYPNAPLTGGRSPVRAAGRNPALRPVGLAAEPPYSLRGQSNS
jgi:hypothetical protein